MLFRTVRDMTCETEWQARFLGQHGEVVKAYGKTEDIALARLLRKMPIWRSLVPARSEGMAKILREKGMLGPEKMEGRGTG